MNVTRKRLAIFFGYVIVLLGIVFVVEDKISNPYGRVELASESITNTLPTDIPTPSDRYTQPTQSFIRATPTPSDPIITCTFSHSSPQQLTSSQCASAIDCQIFDRWSVYPSKNACSEAQRKAHENDFKGSTSTTYTYPTLKPYEPIIYPSATPTISDEQKQQFIEQVNADVSAHNSQVLHCQGEVHNSFNLQVQQCSNRFGSSSATDACVSILNSQRQSALASCGSII